MILTRLPDRLPAVMLCDGARPVNRVDQVPRQNGRMQLHPNAQAVQDALDAAGATDANGQPCRVQILPDAVHTASAAAAALGVEVGQIANSLIFAAGEYPLLILTSGAHRVDTDKIAAELDTVLKRAKPDFVKLHTGQVIGG